MSVCDLRALRLKSGFFQPELPSYSPQNFGIVEKVGGLLRNKIGWIEVRCFRCCNAQIRCCNITGPLMACLLHRPLTGTVMVNYGT